jgi:predicted small secreted protein
MKQLNGILAGKRTYITCGLAIVVIVCDYLMGNISLSNAVVGVLGATAGMTLRASMTVTTDKAQETILKVVEQVQATANDPEACKKLDAAVDDIIGRPRNEG